MLLGSPCRCLLDHLAKPRLRLLGPAKRSSPTFFESDWSDQTGADSPKYLFASVRGHRRARSVIAGGSLPGRLACSASGRGLDFILGEGSLVF